MMNQNKKMAWEESTAKVVASLAAYGITHEDIAQHLGMNVKTLVKYYAKELKEGKIAASAKVGERIFKLAMEGNVTCLLFWAKTRMGWRETSHIDLSSEDSSMSPAKKLQVEFVRAVKEMNTKGKEEKA